MVYMDTNMVRAGVVKYPRDWIFCGYHEIHYPRKGYGRIDFGRLLSIFQMRDLKALQEASHLWIRDALGSKNYARDSKWTESVAVGSEESIHATKEKLGMKVSGRSVFGKEGTYELREPFSPYRGLFEAKKRLLRADNGYFWNITP